MDLPLPSHVFPGLQSDMPTLRQQNIYDVHLSELASDEEYVSIRLFFYLDKWHNPTMEKKQVCTSRCQEQMARDTVGWWWWGIKQLPNILYILGIMGSYNNPIGESLSTSQFLSLARVPRQNGTQRRQVDDGCSAENPVAARLVESMVSCRFFHFNQSKDKSPPPSDFGPEPDLSSVTHLQMIDRRFQCQISVSTRRGKGRQVVPPGRQAHFAHMMRMGFQCTQSTTTGLVTGTPATEMIHVCLHQPCKFYVRTYNISLSLWYIIVCHVYNIITKYAILYI